MWRRTRVLDQLDIDNIYFFYLPKSIEECVEDKTRRGQ